ILELAVLGEADLAQVVLVFGLEVEAGHVVEDNLNSPEDLARVPKGDLLDLPAVPLVETVQKAIDALRRDGLAAVAVEVIHRLELAGRVNQAGDHDVAKQRLRDHAKADLVEEPPEDQPERGRIVCCAEQ